LTRAGSGKIATGFNKQSEALPSAWRVEEPSNIQIGHSSKVPVKSLRTIVLLRMFWVGSYPSNQMYSNFALSSIRIGHVPDEPVYEQFPSKSMLIRSVFLD
jgi:hypothetical protein